MFRDIARGDMSIFDWAIENSRKGNVGNVFEVLSETLWYLKAKLTDGEWKDFCREVRKHECYELFQQDPFTRHSATRPRGYPGDADLLEYIYSCDPSVNGEDCTELGRAIFENTVQVAGAKAVRCRTRFIASKIDELSGLKKGIKTLSIACGYMRELAMSKAVREGKAGLISGIDFDPVTLEKAGKINSEAEADLTLFSINDVFKLKDDLKGVKYDFIYASGLYDYLNKVIAERLTQRLFTVLAPGGTLIAANFLKPCYHAVGCMEIFMRWELLYRSMDEIASLDKRVPQELVASKKCYSDPYSAIGYIEIVKR